MAKPFEAAYVIAETLLPAFPRKVRRDLKRITRAYSGHNVPARMLDVGARKSHYTIGLPVSLVLMDIPRENDVQKNLNLGTTPAIRDQLRQRRSNVEDYLVDDITSTTLPDGSFDIISAIEVIEHVEDDAQFVKQVCRLLKPGGTFYCTTPNGVTIRNTNPDHVRHYTKRELEVLLASTFDDVNVTFEIRASSHWASSNFSWALSKPLRTLRGMFGGILNRFEKVVFPAEAAHLVAVCMRRV